MSETPERRFEHWRRTGDTRALADVFDELAPRLLRLAIHLVGDVSTAEDLVQTTFVSAIESAANWDANRQIEPWLTGILDHRARNVLKVRRDRPVSDPVVLVDDETPLARAIAGEHSRELVKALDQLEEPLRSPMILSALHGLKPAAIAHALDRSPGAVRVQLHRAREILRKSLPVGIASALALLAEPARGLDAVRDEVLSTATRLSPSASVAGAVIGGGLVMKKVVIAVAALLAGLALFLVISRDSEEPGRPTVIASESVELAEPPATSETAVVAVPNAPRASIDAPKHAVTTQPMPHRLLGCVREFPGETPVAGATVELYPVVQRSRADYDARWVSRSQPVTDGSVTPFMTYREDARRTLLQNAGLETIPDFASPTPGVAPLASAITDAEGRFELPSPSLAGVLVVRAAGFGERVHPWMERKVDAEAVRNVYVTRAGQLSARLIDESGAPYEHRVRLTLDGHVRFVLGVPVPGQMSDIHGDVWEVETDERGRFSIEIAARVVFVRAQDPRVGVRKFGWAVPDGRVCEPRPWFSPGEETKDCVIVVRPTCVLAVTDAQTGAPIERFYLASKRAPRSQLSWATWNGWFAAPGGLKCITPEMDYIDDLPKRIAQEGPWSCTVWAPGHAPVDFKVEEPWKAQQIDVRLEPKPGAQLAGRVTRGAEPAAGVAIVIVPYFKSWVVPDDDPNHVWTPTAGARTGADGRFEIELLPGPHLAMFGEGPERMALRVDVPTADLTVDLDLRASLRVRLALPDGTPGADRPVLVKRPDGGRVEGRSDARGEFVVEATCSGEHVVSASAATGLDQHKWDVESKIEARPGIETVLDLVLGADRSVFGRLVVPGTTRLDGWKAQVRGWPDTLTPIEPTGRIPIDLRKAGTLVFSGPDGFEIMLNVPKDARDGHEFKIEVGNIGYEGVLTSVADGKPIPRVRVLAYLRDEHRRGKGMHVATTDASGHYRMAGLEAAPYQIVFEAQAGSVPVEDMVVWPEALPTDPPQRLDLALPTRNGAGFLGAETIQLVGRLAWSSQEEEGVQVHFSSELALPGALVYVSQVAILTADGRYDVRLPRGSKYSAWFWQTITGAKESVSWPSSGTPIERHDVDLP